MPRCPTCAHSAGGAGVHRCREMTARSSELTACCRAAKRSGWGAGERARGQLLAWRGVAQRSTMHHGEAWHGALHPPSVPAPSSPRGCCPSGWGLPVHPECSSWSLWGRGRVLWGSVQASSVVMCSSSPAAAASSSSSSSSSSSLSSSLSSRSPARRSGERGLCPAWPWGSEGAGGCLCNWGCSLAEMGTTIELWGPAAPRALGDAPLASSIARLLPAPGPTARPHSDRILQRADPAAGGAPRGRPWPWPLRVPAKISSSSAAPLHPALNRCAALRRVTATPGGLWGTPSPPRSPALPHTGPSPARGCPWSQLGARTLLSVLECRRICMGAGRCARILGCAWVSAVQGLLHGCRGRCAHAIGARCTPG